MEEDFERKIKCLLWTLIWAEKRNRNDRATEWFSETKNGRVSIAISFKRHKTKGDRYITTIDFGERIVRCEGWDDLQYTQFVKKPLPNKRLFTMLVNAIGKLLDKTIFDVVSAAEHRYQSQLNWVAFNEVRVSMRGY